MVVGACPKHCIYTCLIVGMDDELGRGIVSIILTMAKYCKAGRVFDCAFELQVYQHLFTPEQVLYPLY